MVCLPKESQNLNLYVYELLKSGWNMIVRVSVVRNWLVDDTDSWGAQTTTTATATKTSLKKWSRAASNVACENIRFSSLFASGGVSRQTSPAAKSEEKRMFSQATSNVFAPILSRSIRQMLVPNFWCWILNNSVEVQEKIKKVVVLSSLPPQTYNYAFSRRSRAVTAKNCTKKRHARTDLLFCQSKPIFFFAVLVDVALVVAQARYWRFDNLCRGHHRYGLNTTQYHSFASRIFTAEITAWLTDDLEAVNMEERS